MAEKKIRMALLRGVCQTPAYVAHERGFFAEENLESSVSITPTAWMVPEQLLSGSVDFAVIPWTRVAAAEKGEAPLKLLCGSGIEEAAIVVRKGMAESEVKSVAVPREGGMKDLTAMGLVESMGWQNCDQRRFPSGDGAIISFFGLGADAASMVEPYAAMMEELGVGQVVRRTGDVWKGAPGCSLCASATLIERNPELVQKVVNAYVKAIAFVHQNPDETGEIAAGYIGVHARMVQRALKSNMPHADAIRNTESMDAILKLMKKLNYVDHIPEGFSELRFLDQAQGLC
ncbi:MAG TPA: ABC transporter substrate-binding protein [Kiritimatiellia bacterium]|nr:ABC transporter substrate-binding protein [Kiritimatiellia bacterium]